MPFLKNISILTVFLTAITGCSHDSVKWRIGVSQCSNDDWRTEVNNEIEREIMSHENTVVEIRSADSNDETQIADIRYFIDNGFDAIIVSPNDHGVDSIIKVAYDKGIPVITFDRAVDGDFFTSHIEADNHGIGQLAAKYAANIVPRDAEIIEIQGTSGMTPTIKRHQGFTEEISRHPGLRIVASEHADWDKEKTQHITDSLLDIYPGVSLIYAHNDGMATDASEVARRKGLRGVKILGIDGIPNFGIKAVADSVIDATFLYPAEGALLVKTAIAILNGEPYERNIAVPALSAIDRSNADIILKQKALQKDEIEKIRLLKENLDEFTTLHQAQTSLLYAAVIIVVLLVIVVFLFLRTIWQQKRHRTALESRNRSLAEQRDRQKELYQQLDEATQSKLVFFTNVSHDLRTPLTLISEPLEQMISNKNLTPEQRDMLLNLADKNVRILKRLTNQILDFRKFENGKISVNLSEVAIGRSIHEWFTSFSNVASKRNIRLTVDREPDPAFSMAVDIEKIERVFFNIMSNAFKYTPDNGEIRLDCTVESGHLTFSITDTGIGIRREDLPMIFERFYQVDKVHPNGSGIGLALTKAFVELHDGKITVESEAGKGSVFTVSIPVRHVANEWSGPSIIIKENEIEAELSIDSQNLEMREADDTKPTLLIIDDNKDIHKLIESILGNDYNILNAMNGKTGVKLAAKYTPDLIICDVLMPVMDGMECCRIIKNEVSTSHIPVLMLTACSLDEQRITGYDSGADAYLSKPFSGNLLISRCRNLIDNRRRINIGSSSQSNLSDNKTAEGKKVIPGDIDSDFYARFLKIVEKEMGNPDLSIEDIARSVGLGQSQFTRKIKSLTNYTPVELLRILRVKRARTLLSTTEKTMNEIAYEVGFSSQAYFSKCFKDIYHVTPSSIREKLS